MVYVGLTVFALCVFGTLRNIFTEPKEHFGSPAASWFDEFLDRISLLSKRGFDGPFTSSGWLRKLSIPFFRSRLRPLEQPDIARRIDLNPKLVVFAIALAFGAANAKPAAMKPAIPATYEKGSQYFQNPPKFGVSVGKPRLAAGSPVTATLTVARGTIVILGDGSMTLMLKYDGLFSGEHLRQINIPSCAGSAPITDQYGNQLAATQPAALCTAVSSFTGQVDTMISNAAAANKLNL